LKKNQERKKPHLHLSLVQSSSNFLRQHKKAETRKFHLTCDIIMEHATSNAAAGAMSLQKIMMRRIVLAREWRRRRRRRRM
jgi:hypothetical protein